MGKALCFTAAGHRQVIGPERRQAVEKIAAKLFESASHLARQLSAKLNEIVRIARRALGRAGVGWMLAQFPVSACASRAGVPFFQICNASRGYRTHTIRKGTLPKPPHHIVHQIRFRRVRVIHRAHGHATRRRHRANAERAKPLCRGDLSYAASRICSLLITGRLPIAHLLPLKMNPVHYARYS